MFKNYLLISFLLFSSCLSGKELPLDMQENSSKRSPLYKENKFVLFYAFDDKNLEPKFKEEMIKSFQQIGTVYKPGDESYSTEGIMIYLIASPIIEESSPSDYRKLPVFKISLQVVEGVEVLKNKSQISCAVWETIRFISAEKKNFAQRAVYALNNVLQAFISDYKKANREEPPPKAEFFLYSN